MIATISHIKGSDLTPDLLRQVDIRPEQTITIIIKTETEETLSTPRAGKKRRFEFLHNGTWDDENR